MYNKLFTSIEVFRTGIVHVFKNFVFKHSSLYNSVYLSREQRKLKSIFCTTRMRDLKSSYYTSYLDVFQEFFQKDAMRLPELDGVLYLKEGKKSWKKHYFVLRASGIYYTPKGKTKVRKHLAVIRGFPITNIKLI